MQHEHFEGPLSPSALLYSQWHVSIFVKGRSHAEVFKREDRIGVRKGPQAFQESAQSSSSIRVFSGSAATAAAAVAAVAAVAAAAAAFGGISGNAGRSGGG